LLVAVGFAAAAGGDYGHLHACERNPVAGLHDHSLPTADHFDKNNY
jgi:hypothetical protein